MAVFIFQTDAQDAVLKVHPPSMGYKTIYLASGNRIVVAEKAELHVGDNVDVQFKSLPWPYHEQPEVIGAVRNRRGEVIRTL